MLSLYLHKIMIFGAKIQIIKVKLAFKILKNHVLFALAQKFKFTIWNFFLKLNFLDIV